MKENNYQFSPPPTFPPIIPPPKQNKKSQFCFSLSLFGKTDITKLLSSEKRYAT